MISSATKSLYHRWLPISLIPLLFFPHHQCVWVLHWPRCCEKAAWSLSLGMEPLFPCPWNLIGCSISKSLSSPAPLACRFRKFRRRTGSKLPVTGECLSLMLFLSLRKLHAWDLVPQARPTFRCKWLKLSLWLSLTQRSIGNPPTAEATQTYMECLFYSPLVGSKIYGKTRSCSLFKRGIWALPNVTCPHQWYGRNSM